MKRRKKIKEGKVYTKTGDNGLTSLISGRRVPKHHIRIKAYGAIDELIAWLGLIRDSTKISDINITLMEIQKQLTGPLTTSSFIIIFNLFIGFIVSLISGLILSKSEIK